MDSALFLNDGGHFTDATASYGLADLVRDEYFVGAAFGDYDGDRWPDLFLSSPVRGASVLLHNRRAAEASCRWPCRAPRAASTPAGSTSTTTAASTSSRVASAMPGPAPGRPCSARDADAGSRATAPSFARPATAASRSATTSSATPTAPMATMGAGWGDLDNDGCYDFYLGTGNPEGWFVLPNLLYIGQRRGRRCTGAMDEASVIGGFGTVQKGHAIVFFDFDGDGDEDVYSALGGMWPADGWPNQLFVNESRLDSTWTEIRLRGRETNRSGVGARLRIEAEAADGTSIVRTAVIGNGTGFGSSPYLAHVGLLDARRLLGVEVDWPVSGCTGVYPARLETLNLLDEADCLTGAVPAPNGGT